MTRIKGKTALLNRFIEPREQRPRQRSTGRQPARDDHRAHLALGNRDRPPAWTAAVRPPVWRGGGGRPGVQSDLIGVFVLRADVAGVAYPSLISRIFAAGAMLYLTAARGGEIRIRGKQVFSWEPRMIARIFHIAIPNSVAQSFWSMSALFCIAMGPAFITVVGQYMGAGDPEGAVSYA